ncbi:uncharacterized protein LOC111618142 isoform X1 [Centruroides sculpturatus]|uniref:uncharacterized protein LOC111618142 isoform X1 n=2 Tax=Centruroides sculpturatus TaxID=218467 RepID=UPI000C6E5044|nr:uncharacterized protein LOC111618142 isoform X1 [Centruroides sculpturatus]
MNILPNFKAMIVFVVIFLSILCSEIFEISESNGSSARRFETLFEKVQSINVFKTKILESYHEWDRRSAETIGIIKQIENSLKILEATYIGMIIGVISAIAGYICSIFAMIFSNYKAVSDTLKSVGDSLIDPGDITFAGSAIVNSVFTEKDYKKAETTLNTLMTLTQELEDERKKYFRLVKEFETILDGLNENELKVLRIYLEKNELGNVMNDVDLDPSVVDNIPPNMREMDRLKINEDVINKKIFEFNLIRIISEEIKKDPVMEHILHIIYERENGQNAFNTLQTIPSFKFIANGVDLFGNKLHDLKYSPFLDGMSNVFSLLEKTLTLTHLIAKQEEVSAQCEEIGRIVKQLEEYKSDMKDIFRMTLKWDCFHEN